MTILPQTRDDLACTSPEARRHRASHAFSVDPDGRWSGDDGRQGRLAAAVHYAARMAAQLDSTLDLGPLRHLHAVGGTEVDVTVGWGDGGECLLDGVVRPSAVTRLGALTAVPDPAPASRGFGHMSDAVWLAAQQGTRSAAHVDDAVRRVHARTGAAWTVLLDSDLTALSLLGDLGPGELAVLSSRTQGVVLGLGEPALTTLTMVYAGGTLVLTQLPDATLMFMVDLSELGAVADAVETARLALLEETRPRRTAPPEPRRAPSDDAGDTGRPESSDGSDSSGTDAPRLALDSLAPAPSDERLPEPSRRRRWTARLLGH